MFCVVFVVYVWHREGWVSLERVTVFKVIFNFWLSSLPLTNVGVIGIHHHGILSWNWQRNTVTRPYLVSCRFLYASLSMSDVHYGCYSSVLNTLISLINSLPGFLYLRQGLMQWLCSFGLAGLTCRSASCVLGLQVCKCDLPCLVHIEVLILNLLFWFHCFWLESSLCNGWVFGSAPWPVGGPRQESERCPLESRDAGYELFWRGDHRDGKPAHVTAADSQFSSLETVTHREVDKGFRDWQEPNLRFHLKLAPEWRVPSRTLTRNHGTAGLEISAAAVPLRSHLFTALYVLQGWVL